MKIKLIAEGGEHRCELARLALELLQRQDVKIVKFKHNDGSYKFKRGMTIEDAKAKYPVLSDL